MSQSENSIFSPYDLRERLKETELKNNEIANITGISNTYLKLIEKGEAGKIGRDKILAIAMVALNLPIRKPMKFSSFMGWAKWTNWTQIRCFRQPKNGASRGYKVFILC